MYRVTLAVQIKYSHLDIFDLKDCVQTQKNPRLFEPRVPGFFREIELGYPDQIKISLSFVALTGHAPNNPHDSGASPDSRKMLSTCMWE